MPAGQRRFLGVVGVATLLHATLAALLPLSGDEAYYWDCSRHFGWSYFDQPPLAIWGIAPARIVLGDTALAARFPSVLSALLVAFFLRGLIRRLGGRGEDAAAAYLLLHAMPLFFVGFFYASTDAVMSAAFVAATWAAVAIAEGERRAWFGFGAACGIGFLGKFPIVVALGALLGALLSPRARRHLRSPTPYLAAVLSLVLTAPVWIDAAQHAGANLAFQLRERHAPGAWTLRYLAEFLGANLVIASPPLLAALAVGWWRALRRGDPRLRAVALGAAAPFVLFTPVGLRERIGAHWGGPGLLLLSAPLVLLPFRGRRALLATGIPLGIATSLLLLSLPLFPEFWIRRQWEWQGSPEGSKRPLLAAAIGNRELAAEVERRLAPGELAASESYSLVHTVSFLTEGRVPVRLGHVGSGPHGLASLYWYRPDELRGRNVLFFTEGEDLLPRLTGLFETVEEERPLAFSLDGREIRRVRFYRCRRLLRPEGAFTRLLS